MSRRLQAKEIFGDGKWHTVDKIAEHFGITNLQAYDALRRTNKFKMEQRKYGKTPSSVCFPTPE